MSAPCLAPRHFLLLSDRDSAELEALIERAGELKAMSGRILNAGAGKALGLVFEKPSTRTLVSFQVAMARLGGYSVVLYSASTQRNKGEPLSDMAQVLSSMVDIIAFRGSTHSDIEELAGAATVPVINALTNLSHPCQILADIQTWREHHGDIRGLTAAWIGDGNNVCYSWIEASSLFDFKLRLACPPGYEPDAEIIARQSGRVELLETPAAACEGASILITDVWSSMGYEAEQQERDRAFAGYTVDGSLMARAAANALFMHCLPARRGREVTAEVIDGPASLVFKQAENRLHTQQSLLESLLRPWPSPRLLKAACRFRSVRGRGFSCFGL